MAIANSTVMANDTTIISGTDMADGSTTAGDNADNVGDSHLAQGYSEAQ